MVSVAAADELERQLDERISSGARLLCGGRAAEQHPALFLPAVVEEVPLTSPLATEEIFGPVALNQAIIDYLCIVAGRSVASGQPAGGGKSGQQRAPSFLTGRYP